VPHLLSIVSKSVVFFGFFLLYGFCRRGRIKHPASFGRTAHGEENS